ncbi:MAG: leucyl aminopeptidase [Sedimentisphaerales bacterium]|nr:leucyl aminopeptidase [Sedimentisphaerales bacterium]
MAKQLKKTTVTAKLLPLAQVRADMLVIGLYKNTKKLPKEFSSLDSAVGRAISNLLKLGDFTGKAYETAVLYTAGQLPCQRILIVGLGEEHSLQLKTLRQIAGTAARTADKLGTAKIALALHILSKNKFNLSDVGQAITEGVITGHYDFDDYLPDKGKSRQNNNLTATIVDTETAAARKLNAGCKIGNITAQAQNLSRMIANKPGNEINPLTLTREAKRIASESGLRCKIFDDKQLAKMKMNALLAVGSGSTHKSRLIMLEYLGRGRSGNTSKPDVAIVGKAITFDTGGLNLKPLTKMESQKYDKSGGCNVLSILAAAAQLKLHLHVVGLIPAAENMLSQTSYRPSDIIRTFSGKTVEILNPDAEGRIILCDALSYAAKLKPAVIIDSATLTDSCVVALGRNHAGLFSNNPTLQNKIETAALTSGELVWPMPCGEDYLDQMKSKVADLKNTSLTSAIGREGGACTAAAFLSQFVDDVPWAHIDHVGMSSTDKEKPYCTSGATGFGVRLVLEYLRSL